jgi:predicted carbohydrate-binding protein with CBM5 and CBM33 domain
MTRSKTTESLVSALVILLITLLLVLARATAHGRSAAPPASASATTAGMDLSGAPPTVFRVSSDGDYLP